MTFKTWLIQRKINNLKKRIARDDAWLLRLHKQIKTVKGWKKRDKQELFRAIKQREEEMMDR